jgi:hypothetical protein
MHGRLHVLQLPMSQHCLPGLLRASLPSQCLHVLCVNLGYLQMYPQNWMPSQNSFYPGCYIESCNRMCRLRYRQNDGQVSCCRLNCLGKDCMAELTASGSLPCSPFLLCLAPLAYIRVMLNKHGSSALNIIITCHSHDNTARSRALEAGTWLVDCALPFCICRWRLLPG